MNWCSWRFLASLWSDTTRCSSYHRGVLTWNFYFWNQKRACVLCAGTEAKLISPSPAKCHHWLQVLWTLSYQSKSIQLASPFPSKRKWQILLIALPTRPAFWKPHVCPTGFASNLPPPSLHRTTKSRPCNTEAFRFESLFPATLGPKKNVLQTILYQPLLSLIWCCYRTKLPKKEYLRISQ